MTIKAIKTKYNGWLFKSRLEARWAYFFDLLGLEYDYEREGYEIASGVWYLPDFYVNNSFWVEVKHRHYNDYAAVEKMGEVVSGLKEPGVIVYGDPYSHLAVLLEPTNDPPGYVRHIADFSKLDNAIDAAVKARSADFKHGGVVDHA